MSEMRQRSSTRERLHRPAQPDGVEHRGRGEISVRQLSDETGLHYVDQGGLHAPVGGVGVGEVTLLQGQPPEVVPRHGAGLIQLADEEVGKGKLRLALRLRLRMLWLLVDRLAHRLTRWRPLTGGPGLDATVLFGDCQRRQFLK